MTEYEFPGVFVQEISTGVHAIEGVSTSAAALVGFAEAGPFAPTLIASFAEFTAAFGDPPANNYLRYAVQGYFQNGGGRCYVLRIPPQAPILKQAKAKSSSLSKTSIKKAPQHAVAIDAAAILANFDALDDVSIVCCPDEHAIPGMTAALVAHCEQLRYRIAVLAAASGSDLSNAPPREAQSPYAAYYAPWVMVQNPAGGAAIAVHPGGHIAGAIVANDLRRGIHQAPANIPVVGIVGLERAITGQQQSALNSRGVNALRTFPGRGIRIWGARTTSTGPEWKYINVRRYLAYLEHSIDKGTQWAVFEPNGEQLWSSVRRTISDFLLNEWEAGALLGSKPEQAYFVHCDHTTMSQDDIDNGRLICLIGVAPVKPAEFLAFRICHHTLTTQR